MAKVLRVTVPSLLRLQGRFLQITKLRRGKSMTLQRPASLVFISRRGQNVVLIRYLLVMILRRSSGLRQNVNAFRLCLLTRDLFIENSSRIASDELISRRLVRIISVVFKRSTPYRRLRSVDVGVVQITCRRFVGTVLLRDVALSPIERRNDRLFTQRNAQRNGFVCRERTNGNLLRNFRFHIRTFNPSKGFSGRDLIHLRSRQLVTRRIRLHGRGRYTTRRGREYHMLGSCRCFTDTFTQLTIRRLSLRRHGQFPIRGHRYEVMAKRRGSPCGCSRGRGPPMSHRPGKRDCHATCRLVRM